MLEKAYCVVNIDFISENMLNEYLVEEFRDDEPIFISDLEMKDMSKKAIRQQVSRLAKNGNLAKFDMGIHYIPKPDSVLIR